MSLNCPLFSFSKDVITELFYLCLQEIGQHIIPCERYELFGLLFSDVQAETMVDTLSHNLVSQH